MPDVGSEVSRDRMTGKLGEGGMGVVYKAEDRRLPVGAGIAALAGYVSGGLSPRSLNQ